MGLGEGPRELVNALVDPTDERLVEVTGMFRRCARILMPSAVGPVKPKP